jgi:sugar/nucleoside kinase (ribokinase family)
VTNNRSLTVFNGFLHPDLVVYAHPGGRLTPDRLLAAAGHDMRVGAGAYTGQMAHHLGVPVEYLDWVGDDVFGQFTVDQLAQWGHGLSGVKRFHGDTMVCLSVADQASPGGTMVASYPPAWRRDLDQFRDLVAAAPAADRFYIYSWLWSFPHPALKDQPTAGLVALAAGKAKQVALDPNWKPAGPPPDHELGQLRLALPHVDVLLPNRRDASYLAGEAPPEGQVRRLLDLGVGTVALTAGADGVFVASRDEPAVVHIPTPGGPVRDTTGAGDYFGGAFMAADGPLANRAAFAVAAASLAIARPQGAPLAPPSRIEHQAGLLLARAEEAA